MLPLLPNTIRHARPPVMNARRIRLHPLPRRRQRKQDIHILERLTRRLWATEPDVSGSHDTVQQRPNEYLRPDSVDTRSTTKHHDPSGEPLARGTESSSNVSVLQRCDFGTVHPARAQPPDSENNLVQDDEDYRSPVRARGRFVGGERGEDDVDEHAHAAGNGAPEHQGAAADALDEPDRGVGGDGEDGVEDAGEDAGEVGVVAEVGEDLGAEVDLG